MIRDGKHEGEMVKQVVSYRDDVFVWVYLDQVDYMFTMDLEGTISY